MKGYTAADTVINDWQSIKHLPINWLKRTLILKT